MITRAQYEEAHRHAVPDEDEVDPPDVESDAALLHELDDPAAGRPLPARRGLRRRAEDQDHDRPRAPGRGRERDRRPPGRHRAERLAGGDREQAPARSRRWSAARTSTPRPFNLATNGHRQPGSAFKPFILVRALADGIDPDSTWASQPKQLPFRREGPELFEVNNYEDSYFGVASLWSATATSDNSVFAELGMKVGPEAGRRGWPSGWASAPKLSTNPAMTLGGLEEGVTPLEMAYAYSTIANKGKRVSGSLAPDARGPVAHRARSKGRRHRRGERARRGARVPASGRARCAQGDARRRRHAAAPARPPRSATSTSGARPARPRTTATPGSSAATTR